MKGKQVIAFLLSAVLSVSSCIPLNGSMKISAFAAEPEKLIVENENDEGIPDVEVSEGATMIIPAK